MSQDSKKIETNDTQPKTREPDTTTEPNKPAESVRLWSKPVQIFIDRESHSFVNGE
ncbi:MAG: hypothetical protein HY980_00695 [Candidatus Magasanikbacteria bacterium]|nr:hypothetical protein [Candidatus Magasanikbacteria bacterium]